MIQPTVGRVVWYWDWESEVDENGHSVPRAAIVARVWDDRCVSLAVFNSDGSATSRTSVKLIQDGDPPTNKGEQFCEWMPYQKSKAAAGNPDSESAEPRP